MVQNNFKISCLLFGLASLWTVVSSEICDEFFQSANKFPEVKGQPITKSVVKLCQNHLTNTAADGNGKALYATLFDTEKKIPIYSANAITIDPNAPIQKPRPTNKEWKRVSSALCDSKLPKAKLFYSRISDQGALPHCDLFQALDSDYDKKQDSMDLTRGHLCPNRIMRRDKEKQLGTFTLTNAAPQFTKANNDDWNKIECDTEAAIIKLAPNEKVYMITGVSGTYKTAAGKELKLENRVETPAKYWQLVCYPGSAAKAAWAFGIVRDNVAAPSPNTKATYKTFKSVAQQYFDDDKMPFTAKCLNAPLGAFKQFLDDKWVDKKKCTKDCPHM